LNAPTQTTPALSVVMPSFNQVEFLGEAVCSVLEHSGPEVELVVMDGGSEDGSQALLAELAERFAGRLRWSSGPDGGPAAAVNGAVRQARAPLLGWLNSDDLYVPGALARAQDYFGSHPEHVMVYGNGEHVDAAGRTIELYPTEPPTTHYGAFADGCFICQPTAFMRRDTFLAIGGLDPGLRAAFDFDLWLRMFKAYPGRIGFVDALQAQSRLHAGGITLRFRERVALEGMTVVHRHLGAAPGHWLLTHLEELCLTQPFLPEALDLRTRFGRLIEKSRGWLEPHTVFDLQSRAERDARVRLSHSHVHVGIHADGWAEADLQVRVQQGSKPIREVELYCRSHAPKGGGFLRVVVTGPQGHVDELLVSGNVEFSLMLPVEDERPGARLIFRIHTDGGFIPHEVQRRSSDTRRLAFLVDDCVVRT
jgi:hypothetical protein